MRSILGKLYISAISGIIKAKSVLLDGRLTCKLIMEQILSHIDRILGQTVLPIQNFRICKRKFYFSLGWSDTKIFDIDLPRKKEDTHY